MSALLGYQLFFALLTALGIGLLVATLAGWSFAGAEGRQRVESGLGQKGQVIVTDLPPLAQRVLAVPLTDLGLAVFGRQDSAKLEDRLRRAGWRYQSVGDYYASQMMMMIMLFLLGVVIGVQFRSGPVGIMGIAVALGGLGFYIPPYNVDYTIRQRREALYREMAWTVDRVAAVMKTGQALEQSLNRVSGIEFAWLASGRGGLFTAVLRDISAGLSSRRSDMGDYLDKLRADLPDNMPELDEFLQAVRSHITQRQSIVEQLRALGAAMRNTLNNRIDEVAQKASLQVALLTSGIIIPMVLLIVGGVGILRLITVIQGIGP